MPKIEDSTEAQVPTEVQVPVEQTYNRWTRFDEFPKFMEGIQTAFTTIRPHKPDGRPAGHQPGSPASGQPRPHTSRRFADQMASPPPRRRPGDAPLDGTIEVVREADRITALDLYGEFDINSSPQIIEHAQPVLDDDNHLIINLSDTTFIDSSVVHALVHAAAAAKARGNVLVIQLGTTAIVERVITLTHTDRKIARAPTRAEAITLIHSHRLRSPRAKAS
jgi:anti-anti-sigma factor